MWIGHALEQDSAFKRTDLVLLSSHALIRVYSFRIALKMGIQQNDGKKCPALKIQSFPIPLVSDIQDTFRQGRVQVVFQRDFLAQSGNVEHTMTRRGAGLVNTSL